MGCGSDLLIDLFLQLKGLTLKAIMVLFWPFFPSFFIAFLDASFQRLCLLKVLQFPL